jgi:glutamine amidotransferase
VGAFKDAMNSLHRLGLIAPILEAIEAGKPYLGICLGMQILMTESEEFGTHKGLRVIQGRVSRLPDSAGKIPQVGWNRVSVKKDSPLLKMRDDGDYFYFVHSFYSIPDDPDTWAGTTYYGIEFCSYLWKDNVFATQFHPEFKSRPLSPHPLFLEFMRTASKGRS